MKFTIGIVTTQDITSPRLHEVLSSIEMQEIPDKDLDIIIVGGKIPWMVANLRVIPFDETQKTAWITKKKNIITEEAMHENIVYMHDYVSLGWKWYEGFLKFGNDFDVCMTPIKNNDGKRFRDWTLWPDDLTHILGPWNSNYLLPYEEVELSKHMYFSGAYWIAKKSVMERFPLDETLSWGESEDVKWSKQVREHYKFSLNAWSYANLLKQKERVFNDITPEMLKTLKDHETVQSK